MSFHIWGIWCQAATSGFELGVSEDLPHKKFPENRWRHLFPSASSEQRKIFPCPARGADRVCCKYCTYSMEKWWTQTFPEFFFSFCHFCRLGIPFKSHNTQDFSFPAVMLPFYILTLRYRKKPHFCVFLMWHLGQVDGTFFFGHCSPAQGKSGRKKIFLFQVEKQGVSSWSDLSSCWLLSEAKNASHLDISRCRRKFLHQQLLKCAILTFCFSFYFCFWNAESKLQVIMKSRHLEFFLLVCMFGSCSGKFLELCINSSTLLGSGWPILCLPNTWTFDICRLGFELKIHEWALKTCNLIASLSPCSPCGEKPSLAVENLCT